jgi:Flp pilus assembly protein TadD
VNQEPSIDALLDKARSLVDQCDYDLALRFAERILQRSPTHVQARELLGVVHIETGEIEAAKKVRRLLFFL